MFARLPDVLADDVADQQDTQLRERRRVSAGLASCAGGAPLLDLSWSMGSTVLRSSTSSRRLRLEPTHSSWASIPAPLRGCGPKISTRSATWKSRHWSTLVTTRRRDFFVLILLAPGELQPTNPHWCTATGRSLST